MPDLSAGTTVIAQDFPPTVSDTQNTAGTTTSTSFTATLTSGTTCGVVFTAPTSGRVLVINSADVDNDGANSSFCTFSIHEGGTIGSGTSFLSSLDSNAIRNLNTDNIAVTRAEFVDGLTAGNTYNAQQTFRVAGGTGTFQNKQLTVVPLP